jgi:gamma-glutamyltranspeptidase/glutathione hydrolase
MMSPTLLKDPDGTVTVLGSGGSSRIRTAIVQVISNLRDFHMPAEQAVQTGRVHWEDGKFNVELFDFPDPTTLDALKRDDESRVDFHRPHLFFGGVHLARRAPDGTLTGGGDPRRSGAVVGT